jgi:3-oxoacyl-[acyl-carrier-protein] synthase II
MRRNVVVTGVGVLAPSGIGKKEYWEGLFQGRSGFSTISLFDTSPFHVHIAGEIQAFDPAGLLGKKGLRTLDRSTRLLSAASLLAIEDARVDMTDKNTHSTGISIGTTFGSLSSISQFDRDGLKEGPKYVNPSHFPNTVINSPASQASIRFNIKGFNTTISTGFCASLDAIAYGSDFIRLKRADTVLAGGVEELCEETFRGFYRLGCLSGTDGSPPICCPFDMRRNGTILAEGAAVLVLEDKNHATARGAPILAHILGYASAFDPLSEMTFRDAGTGLRNAILLALKDASVTPDEIDYVSSGANATRGLDRMETDVLKEVFGNSAKEVPVSSIKSMIGETFSASGALSLSSVVGALVHGFIPPTLQYETKDPECDLDYVPNKGRQQTIEKALVISSDPYGNNTAIVLGKYEG